MKIGWAVGKLDLTDSCFLARVQEPHLRMLDRGIDSRIYAPDEPAEAMRDRDVVIFHRYLAKLPAASRMGITLGFDLADDLLSNRYGSLPVDFILTDSLPNTRFYLSRSTHYWPHGFADQTAGSAPPSADGTTRFVYCGAPENTKCLLGEPLEALEAVGRKRPISLRIITNLSSNAESWLGGLPKIEPRNFRIEWVQFDQKTHASLMKECDAGYFPQALNLPRWQKKSSYKPTHAASLGLPCISSPTEEVLMTFLDGQSALIPRDANGWIGAVESMCDPARRQELRRNAIELFHLRFSMDMAVQQVLAIAEIAKDRYRRRRFKGLRRAVLSAYIAANRVLDAVERRIA